MTSPSTEAETVGTGRKSGMAPISDGSDSCDRASILEDCGKLAVGSSFLNCKNSTTAHDFETFCLNGFEDSKDPGTP